MGYSQLIVFEINMSVLVWSCLGIDEYCIWYVGPDACCYWTWGRSDIYPTSVFSAGRCSRTGSSPHC